MMLRRLAAGIIANDQFDDEALDEYLYGRDDAALPELATLGWLHYSDCRTHKLRGRDALSRQERRELARAILFLKTDQEYVHDGALREGTLLGNASVQMLRRMLVPLLLASGNGLWTHLALNSFLLGFGVVVGVVFVSGILINDVRDTRVRQDALRRGVAGETHWLYPDEFAFLDSHRWWPFATRTSYDAALARPPYLYGGGRQSISSLR